MTERLLLAFSGWVEGEDAAKYLTVHRTAPTTKNDLTQNISSARVEKPCIIQI